MNEMYTRIEKLCSERGVNITQMCREADVPRGNLTELKKGRTTVLSSKSLSKIAAYFSVPMDYLLGNTPTHFISGVQGSVVLQGNTGDHISVSRPEQPQEALSEQEQEVLRIFRSLDMRKKTSVLSYLYELEDGGKEGR